MIRPLFCQFRTIPRVTVSPMYATSTLVFHVLLATTVALTGCQGWQPSRPVVESKSAQRPEVKQKKSVHQTEQELQARTARRAAVESTGLDERSREIERSLGAK